MSQNYEMSGLELEEECQNQFTFDQIPFASQSSGLIDDEEGATFSQFDSSSNEEKPNNFKIMDTQSIEESAHISQDYCEQINKDFEIMNFIHSVDGSDHDSGVETFIKYNFTDQNNEQF